jgi:Transposase and inactivated derivatives, TnpA family
VKRQWDSEELVEHFTLLADESILLDNLSGSNRLGFALLLKFFQIEARFPISQQEIPKSVVSYMAKQVDVSPRAIKEYSFSGRTIERHRSQIRQFFGFRETTVEDAFELTKWLQEKVLAYDRQESHLQAAAYQRLRSLKLEPPSPDRMERLIRSAVRTCEETFCSTIFEQLSSQTLIKLDALLRTDGALEDEQSQLQQSDFNVLKTDPGRTSLDSILKEAQKLKCIRQLGLPSNLFASVSPKVVYHYRRRASAEPPRELRRHPAAIRHTLVAAFCWQRSQEITDSLVELLIQIIHRIGINAERRVDKELIDDFKRVNGKSHLLFRIAEASLEHPLELVKDVVYPVVSQKTLQDVVKEYKSTGPTYRAKVYTVMRASYLHHYRRMVPQLLDTLEFRSNNDMHRPVISALELLKKYKGSTQHYYSLEDKIFINGVLKSGSHDLIVEVDKDGQERVNRVNYEICVLQALRDRLRSKEIWVVGAKRYCNPEEDLPQDFESQRETYYHALKQPLDAEAFIGQLQQEMKVALAQLDEGLANNEQVRILKKKNGWISISPFVAQPEPLNLLRLKGEIGKRWPMTSLLDVFKEADLRIQFTEQFKSVASRETIDRSILQKRLLLCLYGLGTNTGLKRICAGIERENYTDLQYVKKRFIHKEHLRNAIATVVNEIFRVRMTHIWGEGTTACASDSKKFGSWDQNLMTEWHIRYGGRGVMIYWHVEKKSACIYSQLKTCSSSEVAAMIEGLLRHCTDMKVQKNYVDTHGQSEIAFAFCRLLGFELLPRLKRIHEQKLYRPTTGHNDVYPNLQPILTRAIDWELIRQQYDQMVKYATALRLGTAEADTILRRFNRSFPQHPTHRALAELGKAVKTIFLCQYLHSEALRREINEGLNVVEHWNGANGFIFYGKNSEIATNRLDEQEVSVLSLHLLQICLVYINTLMIQKVLSEKQWFERMLPEDLRALTPLIWGHVNPYGIFRLDMSERLQLDQ